MLNIRLVLKSMRPTQWYKNLVVGLGLIFSGRFVDPGA